MYLSMPISIRSEYHTHYPPHIMYQISAEEVCVGECCASNEGDRSLFFAMNNTDTAAPKTLCYQVQITDPDMMAGIKGTHTATSTYIHTRTVTSTYTHTVTHTLPRIDTHTD